ncbi:MAG: hypothetical protein PHG02_05535 [Oscillospiraceae bacterium]|nr:hypothetical protein [Oscillospiraceae bacterium]
MKGFCFYHFLALLAFLFFIAFWVLLGWDYFAVYLQNPAYSASFSAYLLARAAQCLLPCAVCFGAAWVLKSRHS